MRPYNRIVFIPLFVLLIVAARRLSAENSHPIYAAWQSAESYTYTTRIDQRTVPLPKLANVGLKTIEEQLYIEGSVDKSAETLHMRLWSDSGSALTGGGSIEIQVENGNAQGRTSGQAWQPLDNNSDFFAPGGDPLGFLHAASNITPLESGTIRERTITKYQFVIDSAAFASFIRDQMEAQQRERGELPPGVRLQASPQLLEMQGSGEIWIDEDSGQPVRQIVTTTFPPNEYDQVSAVITTDFGNWTEEVFSGQWSVVSGFPSLNSRHGLNATITTTLTLAFCTFAIYIGRTRQAYPVFAVVMIYALVFIPLLSVRDVAAYARDAHAESDAQEQETALRHSQRMAEVGIVDPLAELDNPLNAVTATERDNISRYADEYIDNLIEQLPHTDDAEDDADGDGLIGSYEIVLGTDPTLVDSDGDGLDDGLEVNVLGTEPTSADSDRDLIPDNLEIAGVVFGGSRYPLDPLNADTNGDGQLDGTECFYNAGDGSLDCKDSDGDDIPDIAELDDDNDGVPDADDIAPTTVFGDMTTGIDGGEFSYTLDGLTADRMAYVDLQLRPTNPDHLWYTLNVLDWPSDDRAGQVQRVFDATFYESLSADQRPHADPRSKNGDMRLIPMLEISMPYQAGHTRNLPALSGAPAIDATTPLTDWLDSDEMASFGINVRQAENGDLFGYVPLVLQRSESGEQPVAFTGRIPYRPNSAWGDAHSARLIWLVEVVTDRCDVPEGENRQTWCADDANWITNGSTIVHRYDDDFYVTGLAVREDHGVEAAIVFQNPQWTKSQGNFVANGFNEDPLWGAAQALEQTLLAAQNNGTDRTFTIADVTGLTFVTDWKLPTSSLNAEHLSFDHQAQQALLGTTHATELLDRRFTSHAADLPDVSLLYAREETFRLASSDSATSVGTNGLRLTLSSDLPTTTMASVNWSPYRYENGAWGSVPIQEYWTTLGDRFDATLDSYWSEAGAVDGATLLGQAYYTTLYNGMSSIVEVGNAPIVAHPAIPASQIDDYLGYSSALAFGWAVDNLTQSFTSIGRILDVKFSTLPHKTVNAFMRTLGIGNDTVHTTYTYRPTPVTLPDGTITTGTVRQRDYFLNDGLRTRIKAKAKGFTSRAVALDRISQVGDPAGRGDMKLGYGKLMSAWSRNTEKIADVMGKIGSVNAIATMALGIAAVTTAVISNFTDVPLAVEIILSALGVAAGILAVTGAALVAAQLFVSAINIDLGMTAAKNLFKTTLTAPGGLIFALILTVVIAVGLFVLQMVTANVDVGSLAFTQALGGLIAGIIAAALLIALGAVPIVGQLIAGLIALIDAVILLICQVTNASSDPILRDWICPGITGLLSKAVQFLIFDLNPMVDLQQSQRLNLTHWDLQLTDPDAGYVVGNQTRVALDVQTALYRPIWEPTAVSLAWAGQFHSDEFQRWARFSYTLDSSEQSHAETLELNGGANPWRNLNASDWANGANAVNATTQRVTATVPFAGDGINQTLDLYLNEEYVIPAQECWGVTVGSVCVVRGEANTIGIDLGRSLKFDVFPNSLDGFYSLQAANDGDDGYRLDWDDRFPLLVDADGDQLRSAHHGGNDPDDSDPDSDDDTLSDFYELKIGTDPLAADSDGDGLDDATEVRLSTNPLRPDTDYDGLSDAAELEGWSFTYATNSSGNPQQTWVWSDPLEPNADQDAYLDVDELAYGFHPNVTSSGALLSVEQRISRGFVQPNQAFDLTTTITNELPSNHAFGVVETVLDAPLNSADSTLDNFHLPAQAGFVQALSVDNNATGSQAADVTTSVGALARSVDGELLGRSLWLKMAETGGSTLNDSSVNGEQTTCPGSYCPALNVRGVDGSGAQFDHQSSTTYSFAYLNSSAENSAELGLQSGGYTVLAWVKLDDKSGSRPVFGTAASSSSWLGLRDGKPFANLNGTLVEADNTLESDRWYRIAWRYDGATASIFVDGNAVVAEDVTNGHFPIFGHQQLYLGFEFTTSNGRLAFDGMMDEFEIFPSAVSDGYLRHELGQQVFYYRFDRAALAAGDYWVDDSGNDIQMNCLIIGTDWNCPDGSTYFDGIIDGAHRFGDSHGQDEASMLGANTNPLLDLSRGNGAYTLSAWAQPFATGTLLGNDEQSGKYPYLRVRSQSNNADENPRYVVTIWTGFDPSSSFGDECNNGISGISVTQPTNSATWNHYAVSFDGSWLRVYLDGSQVQSVQCDTLPPATNYFFMGNSVKEDTSPYISDQVFGGLLDELRVYNYALPSSLIEALHDMGTDEVGLRGSAEISFDEAPGQTSITDHSFSGLDVTCDNCPVTGVQGLFGQAVRFDQPQSNQEFTIGTANQLGIPDGFAVSAWVNLADNPGASYVFHLLDDKLQLRFVDGKPQLRMGELLPSQRELTADDALSQDRWHHVVWQYRQENAVGYREIYVDGYLVAEDYFTKALHNGGEWPLQDNESARLGYRFGGRLDDVRIFRDPISADRVWQLFDEGASGVLHFDEPQGTTTWRGERVASLIHATATCSAGECPQAGTVGRVFNGLTFDGINDKLATNYRYIDLLDFNAFTAGGWFKPTQIQAGEYTSLLTLEKGSSPWNDRTFGIFLAPNSLDIFYAMSGCNGGQTVSKHTGYSLQLNAWNHLLLTYDGNREEAILYLNGVPISVDEARGTRCTPGNNGDTPVYIGGRYSGHRTFAGQIDEVVLDSSSWSAQRIGRFVSHQAGWMNATLQSTIVIDDDEPTVMAGYSAEFLPLTEQLMSVDVRDATSPIVKVIYAVYDEVAGGFDGPFDAVRDGEAWLLPFTPVHEGMHFLTAVATDAAGNAGGMELPWFMVDATGVPVTIDDLLDPRPQRDSGEDRWFVTLSGSLPEGVAPGSPLTSLRVDLHDLTGNSVNDWQDATFSAAGWEVDYPIDVLATGDYTITIVATDSVSNVTTAQRSILIDGLAPTATFDVAVTDSPIITGVTVISGTVNDSGATVAQVAVSYQPADYADPEREHVPVLSLGFDQPRYQHGDVLENGSPIAQRTIVASGSAEPFDTIPGIVGAGALPMNGSDRLIDIVLNPAFDLSGGAYTQLAWVYPSMSDDAPGYIFGNDYYRGLNHVYPSIAVVERTKLNIGFGDGSGYHDWTTDAVLTADAWNFVAVTFDGSEHRVYVDGALVQTSDALADITPASNDILLIGASSPSYAGAVEGYFKGALDQVEIYTATLSAETIAAHYQRRWQPATLSASRDSATWHTTVPNDLTGAFQITLRTSDDVGNLAMSDARWNGTIQPDASYTAIELNTVRTRTLSHTLIMLANSLLLLSVSLWMRRRRFTTALQNSSKQSQV